MTNITESTTKTQTAAVAEQRAAAAPKKVASTKGATSSKGAKKAKKQAKPAAKKGAERVATKKAKAEAAIPREFSKKAIVLDLLRRKDGATMAEIGAKTGWQNHSIRGFISGAIGKKMGLAVESTKNDAGERVYRIAGK